MTYTNEFFLDTKIYEQINLQILKYDLCDK